jgi:tRNA dimethylallyltransferase
MLKIDKKIIIISGPTASGKSNLTLKMCQERNVEIINADALQLYQELPILSCQPTKEDFQKSPHCCYGILNHKQKFSVKKWLTLVEEKIFQLKKQNKIAIIAGGTGLYISSLIYGINEIPEINEKIAKENQDLYNKIGLKEFIKKMIIYGYDHDKIITLDKNRLLRRMNVVNQTGKVMSYWQNQPKKHFLKNNEFQHIILNPEREILYQNINNRFEDLTKNGAIEEVDNLTKKNDFSFDSQIAKTIGLAEIYQYLQGEITKDDMLHFAKKKTRNLAKRQVTWFKNQFTDISNANLE